MTCQQRHHASSHVGVAQPTILCVQQAATGYLDVHQVDIFANITLTEHLFHQSDTGMESETVAKNSMQRGIILLINIIIIIH